MLVERKIAQIQQHELFKKVRIVHSCIMPTHVHLTIEVQETLPVVMHSGRPTRLTLGHLLNRLMGSCTTQYNRWLAGDFGGLEPGSPQWCQVADMTWAQRMAARGRRQPAQPTLPALQSCTALPSCTAPPLRTGNATAAAPSRAGGGLARDEKPRPLWRPGYNDKILGSTMKKANWVYYEEMNPYFWRAEREFPKLFERRLHLCITMEGGERMHFSSYGCLFLLRKGERVQVQCTRLATRGMLTAQEWSHFSQPAVAHRLEQDRQVKPLGHYDRNWLTSTSPACKTPIPYTITSHYARLKEQCLELAAQGDILVSPAISAGEKDIVYSALQQGCTVIKLRREPFTTTSHPSSNDRQWCAHGSMLVLAPWPSAGDTPTESRRQQFSNLNQLAGRLCQQLTYLSFKNGDSSCS